ncbi:phage tail protein [Clostridium sardiniense]|uniref:phage tail protein n=1 Tax=Clostridium sardiniense TaxID=29369 RepID=UPI003D33E1D0
MLQLLSLNKTKIAGLIEYKDLCIESVLETGNKTLSFLYPKNAKNYYSIVEECYIKTKTNEFIIKESSPQGNYTSFVCELNLEELEGKPFDRYESVEQTITAALNLAIVGTGWTVADNTIKKKRTVRKTDCSSLEIVQEIKKTYRVDIEFDTLNKIIKVYEHLGEDKGTYFIDSLNLRTLQIQGNSYDYATRIIPIGKDGFTIESINNGKNYVENYQYSNKVKTIFWKDDRYTIVENLKEDAEAKLKEISKPYRSYEAEIINLAKINKKYKVLDYKLGDTISLISRDNKIKDKQRIVKTIEYPQNHNKDTVELANTILSFENIQKQFQDTSDTVDNVTLDNGTLDGEAFENGGISSDKIDNFKANVIEAAEIHVIKGDIQDLNVALLKAGQAILTKVDTAQLNALESKLQHALIGKADVNELNVAVERVGILEGKTLSVENQLAGNLTAKNFHANAITAGSGIIANGAIGDAQISSLSVNKLEAGDISTSKFRIISSNGSIQIVGNQILVNRDNINRVILGEYRKQDNTTDYGLLIRAKDCKTVMFDSEGVHSAGITDGAINNNKVADNANIAGNKLDINSVIREVNGAKETIKGTRVQIGDRTLDIELSTQKNTITEHGKELSTQKTTIQALDKAIKLKVDNQTFTQSTNTINSNINNINSDLIGKINTSLNNVKSYADTKKQEAINNASTDATNKANNALNSAKTFTTSQITTTNSNLSKAKSEINILKEQINTKVSQADINRSIQEIKIGGTNLISINDISKIDCSGSYNANTNTWSLSSQSGLGTVWGAGLIITNVNTRVPYGQGFILSFEIKVPVDCTWNVDVNNYAISGSSWSGNDNDNVGKRATSTKNLTANKWIKCWSYWENTSSQNTKFVDLYEASNFGIINNTGKTMNFEIRNVKGELGNKVTDWSPCPKDINKAIVDSIKVVTDRINDVSTKLVQAKDSLQASVNSLNSTTQTITTNLTNTTNKIDNLKVGSRNYVRYSNFPDLVPGSSNISHWNYWGDISVFGQQGNTYYNKNGVAYLGAVKGGGIWQEISSTFIKPNTEYTLSLLFGEEPNVKHLYCWIEYWGENNNKIKADCIFNFSGYVSLERRSYVFRTINSEFKNIRLVFSHEGAPSANGYLIQIGLIQLEEGNINTDWKLDIEDTKNNILDAKQQAINSANSHADAIAISKSNEVFNNAKTYTNTQITTVNTRVANAESSINILKGQISTKVSQSDIDKTVNNIQIGGRNYAKGTSYEWRTINGENRENQCINWGDITQSDILNKDITISFEYEVSSGAKGQFWLQTSGNYWVRVSDEFNVASQPSDKSYRTMKISIPPDKFINVIAVRMDYFVGQLRYRKFKVESGTKPTDWTPAPEDINQEIKDNITTVTEKINTVESTLTQKTNNINASVNSIQSILTTKADGSIVSSMQSQLSSLNIGLNGIKTEVNKKTDKGSIISEINQSAESVKINASKIELNGITTFSNVTGLKAIEIQKNSIDFYDWEGGGRHDNVGTIYSVRVNSDSKKPGLAIGHEKNAVFTVVYSSEDTYHSYIDFDKYNVVGHVCPITFYEDISLNCNQVFLNGNKGNSFYENVNGEFSILAKHGVSIFDTDTKRCTALLGSDKTCFRKWNELGYYAEFFPDGFRLGNGNGGSYLWADAGSPDIYTGNGVNIRVQGSLSVRGSKNRIVDTVYGDLTLNAVESTECWFTDIGIEQNRTDNNGDCIIWFDNKFLSTVNTRYKYKIDVTPIGEFASNGKLTYVRVVEKTEKYFKVRGTPNTLFDWTITAKQKGYERDRLETMEKAS